MRARREAGQQQRVDVRPVPRSALRLEEDDAPAEERVLGGVDRSARSQRATGQASHSRSMVMQ